MSEKNWTASHPRWLVSSGNFFFRHRNALFPVVIALLILLTKPSEILYDHSEWRVIGLVIAVAGQLIRLLTIGYDYIDRGGRDGKVYASRLVQGGVYAHVRNPMYVGNVLIAAGLLIFSRSLPALLIGLPFFIFVYAAITAAEEVYLQKSFGADYAAYCETVPRFIPRWQGLRDDLSRVTYDWKKALRKDYGNLYLLGMSNIVLSVWADCYIEGVEQELADAPQTLTAIVLTTLAYFTIMRLKKTKRLE